MSLRSPLVAGSFSLKVNTDLKSANDPNTIGKILPNKNKHRPITARGPLKNIFSFKPKEIVRGKLKLLNEL